MKQWNKSYHNLVKDRFWVKRMEDLSNLKTPEHVQQFDRSQVARDAVRIIGESQDGGKENGPTHQEYTRNTCTQQPLAQGNYLRMQIFAFSPLFKKQ